MNKSLLHAIPVLVFGLLVLSQFNNCSTNQADQPVTTYTDESSQGTNPCTISGCVEPSDSWLKLTANVPGSQFGVTAPQREFNIGGDCNEGGYPSNEIRWELGLNGAMVRNSTFAGLVPDGGTANSQCVNGRYMIYVNLSNIPQDPVDRVGLRTSGGVRSSYTLDIQLFSKDKTGGSHTETINAKKRVILMPL